MDADWSLSRSVREVFQCNSAVAERCFPNLPLCSLFTVPLTSNLPYVLEIAKHAEGMDLYSHLHCRCTSTMVLNFKYHFKMAVRFMNNSPSSNIIIRSLPPYLPRDVCLHYDHQDHVFSNLALHIVTLPTLRATWCLSALRPPRPCFQQPNTTHHYCKWIESCKEHAKRHS